MDEALKRRDGELYPAEDGEGEVEGDRKRQKREDADEKPEEEGEEAREVRAPPIPETPSREQVLVHRLTHRPYRS